MTIRHHATGTHQLIQKVYQDRLCWQASVACDDDMGGRFGDTPDHPRKRAQLMDDVLAHEGDARSYRFSTLFPADWERVGLTTVMSLHQSLSAGDPVKAPFIEMYADEDSLSLRIQGERGQVELMRKRIIPEQWDDWEFTLTYSATQGGMVVKKNGQVVVQYIGPTRYVYDRGTYFLLGPYVFQPWPIGVYYRRMYIQVS